MAADGPNGAPLVSLEAIRPAIVLTFEGTGSAGFGVSAVGVTPAQLYAAACYLENLARATFDGELRRQATMGLVPAGPDQLDQLRRAGRV